MGPTLWGVADGLSDRSLSAVRHCQCPMRGEGIASGGAAGRTPKIPGRRKKSRGGSNLLHDSVDVTHQTKGIVYLLVDLVIDDDRRGGVRRGPWVRAVARRGQF